MAQNTSRIIVGLDIGTNKIAVIVGELSEDRQLEIVGIGSHHSRGLKKRRCCQYRIDCAIDSTSNRGS
ncbi:MAG: hypothetical protein CM1200mP24_05980 [Gammaproteobacteria bacterium]|nr:MAG: hypothetical protein CM1200mP24_05980 [Gammaproteobacteria bacterium]